MKAEIKKIAVANEELPRNERGTKLAFGLLVLMALIPGIVGLLMGW